MRVVIFFSVVLAANVSWASLDWNVCSKQLDDLNKTEADAVNLAPARDQAMKLRDLYERIETQRFEYNRCKGSADGTQYCNYIQMRLNGMLDDYQAGRNDFNRIMLSYSRFPQSKGQPCGFTLPPE